jgi:hypothetical protein
LMSRPALAKLVIGSVLCCLCLGLLIGFRFGQSPSERAGMGWVLWGFAFWTLAFGILPANWLRRQSKRPKPT